MRASVTLEYRFSQTADGKTWTQTTFPYEFWKRYLDVFSEVNVIARANQIESIDDSWTQVDGPGVQFSALPYYIGPVQYLRCRRRLKQAVRAAIHPDDAAIFRLSSSVAAQVLPDFIRSGRPYGVEIVADPYDVFAPGANDHFARAFFQWYFPRRLRHECKHAAALSAVTRDALQQRYPAAQGVFTTHYSSIQLEDDQFAQISRSYEDHQRAYSIVMVGGLSQLYKAPHILIDAVAQLMARGTELKLKIVGDGRCRKQLEAQVAALGLESVVQFCGQLPGLAAVSKELDNADLFVLPSFQEGLPRAMIEAMARALPCIGSNVGGFPELLEKDEMVPAGDAGALADKILEMISDSERLTKASARNLDKAREYHEAHLRQRRNAFYTTVLKETSAWLAHHPTLSDLNPGSQATT